LDLAKPLFLGDLELCEIRIVHLEVQRKEIELQKKHHYDQKKLKNQAKEESPPLSSDPSCQPDDDRDKQHHPKDSLLIGEDQLELRITVGTLERFGTANLDVAELRLTSRAGKRQFVA
jgi:hypothetical protein